MCGRYAATANPAELVEEFDIAFVDDAVREVARPRYNIAPTDPVPAVLERHADGRAIRKLVPLKWGLVPSWAKSPAGAARLINARVETVTQKPSFRRAASVRRCLLPALGYYEWRTEEEPGQRKPVKQPYFLHPDSGVLALAGLYELWRGADGWLATATIITTEATDAYGWVHDRMPMVVPREAWDDWLDPMHTDAHTAVALLQAPLNLAHRKVSRAVNKVGTEGPQLVEAVP